MSNTEKSISKYYNVYERLQHQPSEKILDDRPEPDPDIPPIPLPYDGFGHFLDIVDAHDDVPGLADVDVLMLRKEVDDLASKMTGYFNNEDDQRDAALPCLDCIFSVRGGITIPKLAAAAIGSDGYNIATHGTGTMAVKVKNWSTGTTSLPQIELVCYIVRLDARGMDDNIRRQLYLQWRVPCLGLTIIGELNVSCLFDILIFLGCDIMFYAIVLIDHHFRLVTLTPTFSCIQSALDGCDCMSLYLAFSAASVLQAHILHNATRLLDNPPPVIPVAARHFPAVSRLRKYPASSDGYFNFEI